tara:strand:+ start:1480 stop:1806 length:327 start_codon:yes stop_codon:yes gene_type:complete
MGIPEIILLAWYAISLAWILFHHGQPTKPFSWKTIVSALFGVGLLVWGGFFASFGAPQALYILFFTLVMGTVFLNRDKHPPDSVYNFYMSIPIMSLYLALFWWGGFFA